MEHKSYEFEFTGAVTVNPEETRNVEMEDKIIYLEDIVEEVRFQLESQFSDAILYGAEEIAHQVAEDLRKKYWAVL